MFKSEAMFRKHQQQAHRSTSEAAAVAADMTNFVADAAAAVSLDAGGGGQTERVPPLSHAAMATYYSCTVCKMIFSSVGEIQDHVSNADCGRGAMDDDSQSSNAGDASSPPPPPPPPLRPAPAGCHSCLDSSKLYVT